MRQHIGNYRKRGARRLYLKAGDIDLATAAFLTPSARTREELRKVSVSHSSRNAPNRLVCLIHFSAKPSANYERPTRPLSKIQGPEVRVGDPAGPVRLLRHIRGQRHSHAHFLSDIR